MPRSNPGSPPSDNVWRRQYYTCAEAAALTGIGASTWRSWCAEGRFSDALNLSGRQWLIPRAEVEKHASQSEESEERETMHTVLENGCEIVRGHGVEVGLMQTEIPGKPEAWLFWMEGQGLTSERQWNYGTRAWAIEQINVWLETIGLVFKNNQIVELY